jgi:ribosomal protein S18 acetylase RimI-like enzyme
LLQPYRSRGLGAKILKQILVSAEGHTKPRIGHVYLHVQTSNEAAKKFYEGHGFQEVGVHENYYKKIEPRDAWILERVIDGQSLVQP